MTEMKAMTKGLKDHYDIKIFALTAPKEYIYSRINARVEKMFALRLVREVRKLKKKVLSRTANAAIGIKEVAGYLNGEYDLDTAKELLKQNTRNFAKRQMTWFRSDKRIRWFDVSKIDDAKIIKDICKAVSR